MAHDETPAFLGSPGNAIFSVLHRPEAPVRGGLLFCHPLGEEKLWSHRVLVSFARRLAASGWVVLRMDCRGEGDSDREFEDTDLATRVEDILTGLTHLRVGLPTGAPIGLLGLRMGALVAAVVATRPALAVDRLILWDPPLTGAQYMQTVLLTNLAFQMAKHRKVVEDRKALVERLRGGATVNIEGYLLSGAYHEQVTALDLRQVLPPFGGRGLLVQVDPGPAPPRGELVELAGACQCVQFAQAVEEPFWKETKTFCQRADALSSLTETWLGQAS